MVTPNPAALQAAEVLRAERAARIGEIEAWLQANDTQADDEALVVPLEALGRLLIESDEFDAALVHLRERELPLHRRRGNERSVAATMGRVADILQARGDFDEALRIRQQQQLPVYKRMGDEHERAVTMGKIADVLQARGKFDVALRIRRHEELAVYERLGDERSRAVTTGKVADILRARGQLDDAQRILEDDVLSVFERLDDVRSRAATMSRIADVARARGQLDEAQRILEDEVLPVHERLGDSLARAFTVGKIADILEARGHIDEALRIRQHEELPVYERLGDVRARAVTQGKVGLQLAQTGAAREQGAAMSKEALASLRALRLPEAHTLAEQMKSLAIPTKQRKPREPVDDGWTKFEGDFDVEQLETAARSGEPIAKLSITKTRFTKRRSIGLRGMRADTLWLWCDASRAAMADVIAIEGLRVLDVLKIDGQGAMPSFAKAVTLEEFRCPFGLSTQDIAAIVQAPALEQLSVHNSTLDLPLVRHLATLPNLRSLDIECTNFDDDMAEVIASHPTLTELEVGGTRLTARGLTHICRMRQLESLDLWESKIGIDDLQQLQALDRLQYLSIGMVDDSGPDGDTAVLTHSIRGGIRVDGNPSHDAQAVVELLLRMPSLQRVWLDGVKLSNEQKQMLESRLESLRM